MTGEIIVFCPGRHLKRRCRPDFLYKEKLSAKPAGNFFIARTRQETALPTIRRLS